MSWTHCDNRQKEAPRCGYLLGMKLHLQIVLCLLVVSWSLSAHAHGPRPQVLELSVSYTPGGGVHALTNNQGVFADLNSTYRWVCEDAIYPLANTQGLALFGESDERWVVATNHGIHISMNSGCEFAPASGDVGVMRTAGLWRFSDTDLLMTGSMKLGEPNRLYKSSDQGHTWDAGADELDGQVLSVQWFSGEAPRMLVHTDRELYLAGHEGENASPVSIATEAIQIAGHLVRSVAIDPSENRRILIAVDGGNRLR